MNKVPLFFLMGHKTGVKIHWNISQKSMEDKMDSISSLIKCLSNLSYSLFCCVERTNFRRGYNCSLWSWPYKNEERACTFLLCYQMNTEVLSWWSKENFRIETNIEKIVVKNFLISVSWQNTSVGSAWIRDMPEIISPTCAIAGKQG